MGASDGFRSKLNVRFETMARRWRGGIASKGSAPEFPLRGIDEDVLAEADYRAERNATATRLAVALCIVGLLGGLVFATGRMHEWILAVCIANLGLAALGYHLTRTRALRNWFPWLASAADAFFLFGVGWFGPWLDVLPTGFASALVSQWGVFLILAIEALRAQARTILFQTALICTLLSVLIWWPVPQVPQTAEVGTLIDPLFSDPANVTRIAFVMLAGLVLAIGAHRSRKSLKLAITASRERMSLKRFHSSEIDRQIATGDMETLRRGSRHEVAILFADLRGFTAISETLPPEQVVKLLTAFRTRSERVIEAHGGVVEKFVGDGFLAVFGLVQPGAGDATASIAAADALLAEMDRWSDKRCREGRQPVGIGIGIHSGEVFVGAIGDSRMEFTVIGDAVNVAQRLEAMTRDVGCALVVSQSTATAAGIDATAGGEWTRFTGMRIRGRTGDMDALGKAHRPFRQAGSARVVTTEAAADADMVPPRSTTDLPRSLRIDSEIS